MALAVVFVWGAVLPKTVAQNSSAPTTQRSDNPIEKAQNLVRQKKYMDAYELLQSVRDQYGTNRDWMRLTIEVDDYFVRTKKRSMLYSIDRLTYKVKLNANDSKSRYALVDQLMEAGRFYEAEEFLDGQRFINDKDPQYVSRKSSMAQKKATMTTQKIAQLQSKLQSKPNDAQTLRELAYFSYVAGDKPAAMNYYQQTLQLADNPDVRYEYAELLMTMEQYDLALGEIERLLQARPNTTKYKNLYASITLFSGKVTERTEQYLQEILQAEPSNIDVLANMALLKTYQGKLAEADRYARRAQTSAGTGFNPRLEELDGLIARSKQQGGGEQAARYNPALEKARQLYREGKFFDAADAFEEYFRLGGPVTKTILAEMGNAIAEGGDPESAIGVLQRALVAEYDPTLVLRIAQLRYDMNDFPGAITVVEEMHARGTNSIESYRLLGDAYAKARWYAKAREMYNAALALAPGDAGLQQRINWAKPGVGKVSAYDYAALIIPQVSGITANGFETKYEALAMGISSQVTLPIPVVLTANFTSGGNAGTRFQFRPGIQDPIKNPDGSTPLGLGDTWYNRVTLGGFIDFTKPMPYRFAGDHYTNRLAIEGGLQDYSGSRTAAVGAIRFYHQTKDKIRAVLGATVDEGATALWSPAGAENQLRLFQLSAEAGLPRGQKFLLNASYAYNVVKDAFGENKGQMIGGDIGYKTFKKSYLGASYLTINYDQRVNFYFSPTDWTYQEASLWLLHDRDVADKYYLRFKAGPGILINNDFAFGRGELDVIYKAIPNLGIGLMARTTQSFRYRNKLETNPYNNYSILVGGISVYWTL